MNFTNTKKTATLFWELLRMRNGLITFFGVLVSASFICMSGIPIVWLSVLTAGFAAFLLTGAGNALNDYFDYEIDKINKPNRPIPSGRISRSDTFMLSIVLFLLGLGFSKNVNNYCLGIAFLNSVILVIYAMYSKKLLFISNLSISFLVSSIFIFGVAATVQEGMNISSMKEMQLIAILTVCSFLITLSREMVKDIEDIKGDKKRYALTLPIKIGVKRTKTLITLFTLSAIIVSFIPFFMHLAFFNIYVYGILIGIADIVFLVALTMNPALSQRMMILGMIIALTGFFFGNIIPLIIN